MIALVLILIGSSILSASSVSTAPVPEGKHHGGLEEEILHARASLGEDADEVLRKLLNHVYHDDESQTFVGLDESSLTFKDLSKRVVEFVLEHGHSLNKSPEMDIHEHLVNWRDNIMRKEIGRHCESLMSSLSTSYEKYLDMLKHDKESKIIESWNSRALETLLMADLCHRIEANADRILLIGHYDPMVLIDMIFAQDDQAVADQTTIMDPDTTEDLLQVFMSVNDAYEEMQIDVDTETKRQRYEDIGGYALIIGQQSSDKCYSAYINSLKSIMGEYGKYLHLGPYLLSRIQQQSKLCGKELDLAVGRLLKNADPKYVSVLDKLSQSIKEKTKSVSLESPLYIEIPDEAFMDSVIDYLREEDKLKHLHDLEGDSLAATLTDEDQEEVFQLLGQPSIEIVQRLEALLIFFFDLVSLINDLGLETSQVMTKSTLDVMTKVNLSEKILTFSDN